ncbi:alanine racemase [Microbacterium sp. GXF7504]
MTAPRLRVDLDRVLANIDTLRARLSPAELMLVVKNDAYGHGVDAIVTAAARHGVRWFGAFDVPTGLRVRAAAGPDARVFSWATAARSELDDAVHAGLDIGVGDARSLTDVADAAGGRPVPVHLKIDTGLHRNGVRREDWPPFVDRAAALEAEGRIRVVGVWSHLAETSDATDDAARDEYLHAVTAAQAAGLRPEVRHLAASAASFAREEFRFDLTRVGAFGYGIRSAGGEDLPGIVPAATLVAPVTAVGPDAVTVGVGALDGIPSTLAGRVDVGTPAGPRRLLAVQDTALEVASWPGAAIGDEVHVFGPGSLGEATATTLAETIDTVGEELLVRLSPRIRREYVTG